MVVGGSQHPGGVALNPRAAHHLEARTNFLDTPLMAATIRGRAECVELLLRAGAIVDAANNYGVTPLRQALINGDAACFAMLLRAGASPEGASDSPRLMTPLAFAAHTGKAGFASLLLDCGAEVNRADPARGNITPLLAAAHGSGRGEPHRTVALLLRRGADPHARLAGRTVLHLRATCPDRDDPSADCIQELVAFGADLGAATPTGETPLGIAAACPETAGAAAALLALGCPLPASLAPPARGSENAPGAALAAADDGAADDGAGGEFAAPGAALPFFGRSGLFARGRDVAEGIAAALRAGPVGPTARLWGQLAAAAGGDPLRQVRLLAEPGAFAPGEAWWGETSAERRPPRYAALLLDRAARATVVRECAERALAEAAGRSVRALQQWQRSAGAGGGGPGRQEHQQHSPSPRHSQQQQQQQLASSSQPQWWQRLPIRIPLLSGGGDAGRRTAAKLTFAAAACVAKWSELRTLQQRARRDEEEAHAALSEALRRAEERALELRARAVLASLLDGDDDEEEGGESEQENNEVMAEAGGW